MRARCLCWCLLAGAVVAPAAFARGPASVPAWVQHAAAGVTIAVIDTGVDPKSPALAGRVSSTWNVVTGSATVSDSFGHGTLVASLAASGSGEARLMVVQASAGDGTFSDLDDAAAIRWAVDHGANIVNLSLGGSTPSSAEASAVRYAIAHGVLLVAAAGNSGDQGDAPIYPAAFIGRSGVVVGASGASYSTRARYVDLLAPGDAGGARGTSYAAPRVAAAAALVLAADPALTAGQVASVLETTASSGQLDTAAAVRVALTYR